MSSRLAAFIRDEAGADSVAIANERRLAGGAIQENRALDIEIAGGPLAGRHKLVLRTEAKSSVPLSQPVANQFACLERARSVGMTVPEPLWQSDDPAIVGAPFYLMRRIEGEALGNRVVRQGPNPGLAATLGRELARLHRITPPDDALAFLGEPPADPAASGIALYRGFLDAEAMPHPAIEWGLRWLETHPVGTRRDRALPPRFPHRQLHGAGRTAHRHPRLGVRRLGRPDGGCRLVLRAVLALRRARAGGRRHRRPRAVLRRLRGGERARDRPRENPFLRGRWRISAGR